MRKVNHTITLLLLLVITLLNHNCKNHNAEVIEFDSFDLEEDLVAQDAKWINNYSSIDPQIIEPNEACKVHRFLKTDTIIFNNCIIFDRPPPIKPRVDYGIPFSFNCALGEAKSCNYINAGFNIHYPDFLFGIVQLFQ